VGPIKRWTVGRATGRKYELPTKQRPDGTMAGNSKRLASRFYLWAEVQKETRKWKSRWKSRDLLADGRCGPAVLDFLTSTDVGRLVPPLEKSDTGSQVSEWELRDRREREEEREAGVEELGAAGELDAGEELPLFLPTPPFMASAGEE